mmetsp:Transcript_114106/g.323098  ORF Transcript_114106/g.323098 Transcript_114106/m.323098 type:complete len:377 (-) Transcript_114106:29-1159(-)
MAHLHRIIERQTSAFSLVHSPGVRAAIQALVIQKRLQDVHVSTEGGMVQRRQPVPVVDRVGVRHAAHARLGKQLPQHANISFHAREKQDLLHEACGLVQLVPGSVLGLLHRLCVQLQFPHRAADADEHLDVPVAARHGGPVVVLPLNYAGVLALRVRPPAVEQVPGHRVHHAYVRADQGRPVHVAELRAVGGVLDPDLHRRTPPLLRRRDLQLDVRVHQLPEVARYAVEPSLAEATHGAALAQALHHEREAVRLPDLELVQAPAAPPAAPVLRDAHLLLQPLRNVLCRLECRGAASDAEGLVVEPLTLFRRDHVARGAQQLQVHAVRGAVQQRPGLGALRCPVCICPEEELKLAPVVEGFAGHGAAPARSRAARSA